MFIFLKIKAILAQIARNSGNLRTAKILKKLYRMLKYGGGILLIYKQMYNRIFYRQPPCLVAKVQFRIHII